jgi:enoyl-CoA hydratase
MTTDTAAAGTELEPDILFSEQGRAALITLNRPKALNALTLGMIRDLEAFYHKCARAPQIYGIVMEGTGRAFCSGGDIRYIYDVGRDDFDAALRFYTEEYQHNWTLECFIKPNVALIDGIVMGGGVGVCLYGVHRVAGENTRFAMPETGIGFFPDVGGGWFLPRMPGETGMYLGLTGAVIGQADMYYVGAATHCMPAARFETVKAAMIEADPIDPVLDSLHELPAAAGQLPHLQAVIDRVFSAPSVEEIIARLADETGEHAAWAAETRRTLLKRSPLALKVAFEQLRRGKAYTSLKEALIVEHRLLHHILRQPDLYEGIRAAIVDKSRPPVWQPATLAEVSDDLVRSWFEPLPEGDLELKDYWKLVD